MLEEEGILSEDVKGNGRDLKFQKEDENDSSYVHQAKCGYTERCTAIGSHLIVIENEHLFLLVGLGMQHSETWSIVSQYLAVEHGGDATNKSERTTGL